MSKYIFSIAGASAKIASEQNLVIAGDEKALSKLPQGSWTGGTIPFFVVMRRRIFTGKGIYYGMARLS